MHTEIAADPVAGAVIVIEPLLPERATGEGVELRAGGAFGEPRRRQRDVALEDAGEAVAHFRARGTDRDRAGNVGRAVEVLRARIEEEEGSRLEPLLALRGRPIMHDRAVRSGTGDRREAQIAEMLAAATQFFEPVADGDLAEL